MIEGADLVQIYDSLFLKGPYVVNDMLVEL